MKGYNTAEQQYAAIKQACPFCLAGKCAERRAAGLCHCGDPSPVGYSNPQKESPTNVRSQESPLVSN